VSKIPRPTLSLSNYFLKSFRYLLFSLFSRVSALSPFSRGTVPVFSDREINVWFCFFATRRHGILFLQGGRRPKLFSLPPIFYSSPPPKVTSIPPSLLRNLGRVRLPPFLTVPKDKMRFLPLLVLSLLMRYL